MGCESSRVSIDRLADQTFYAAVVLDGPTGSVEVDARPSDALTLALVTGAPIRVDRGLLEAGPQAILFEGRPGRPAHDPPASTA
ncbi:MAG TPA: bifunctional nuclease domain-containing protein [Actinomycetes bacterium]|nr:bifunctional nuclease domain-containing protein [Actinomycetes bacterium]